MLLEKKKILIAGASGPVGESIVRILLDYGAKVILPYIPEERPFRNPGGYILPGDIHTLHGARELLTWIHREMGDLDGVISAIGQCWHGVPLLDLSLSTWQRLLENSLTTHFIVAKTFLPGLLSRRGSSFTFINGAGGVNTVPHAGPTSISAAGEIMLKDVLSAENHHRLVRINTLVLETPVTAGPPPEEAPEWLTAADVGHCCALLASENGASIRGATLIIKTREQMLRFLKEYRMGKMEEKIRIS